MNQKFSLVTVLILVVMTAIAVFLASGILFENRIIYNAGNVNAIGVGVYWESGCVNNVSSIDWGFLEPGGTQNVTVYIRNEGNVPMTLNMTVDSWAPSLASSYITVSWNREGYVVDATSIAETIITLSVSNNISNITNFSFDLTIIGTGQFS